MQRWKWQGIWLGAALGLASAALAEEPKPAPAAPTPAPATQTPASSDAVAWDDSHMQSRYEPVKPSNRPRLEGETSYGLLARGGGGEARTSVEPELEFTSQRQWVQGSLSSQSSDTSPMKSGSTGGVHRSGRSGTPSSALRAGSVHTSN